MNTQQKQRRISDPFEPVTIGPLRLRNRFIKSGANEAMCLEGRPTKALVRHHVDLARGGVGVIHLATDPGPDSARINYDGESRDFKNTGNAIYLTFLLSLTIAYLVLAPLINKLMHGVK